MSIKISGMNEFTKNINSLQNRLKEINGTHEISLTELFSPEFIARHSTFSDIEKFFEASGFPVTSQADFEKLPQNEWDKFVIHATDFSSWDEMKARAGEEFFSRKLNLK